MHLSQEQKGSLFLLLILAIIATVGTILFFSLREDPVGDVLRKDQVIETLLVMEDNNQVLSTNVLLYYPVSHLGAVINIPGNTGAIFSSIGRVDRIDQVYLDKGIQTYKTEIEKLIGTQIPFYIVINLQHFQSLTDRLGGMKVLVPSPVDAVSSAGDRWLLPSGAVLLDGDKIAQYLEYSIEDETDSSMEERRQNIILAFLSAITKNASVMFDKKNFKYYAGYFKSNVDSKDLCSLLREIAQIDSERIVPQTVTGTRRMVDGKELLFPFYDGQLIKDVMLQTVNSLVSKSGTLSGRVYVIEIQNGTSTQGLARNTGALLKSAGYDVLRTTNAVSNKIEKTEIVDHIGNKDVVKSLADFIHCENITEEDIQAGNSIDDRNQNVDFTIILGNDFDGRYVH